MAEGQGDLWPMTCKGPTREESRDSGGFQAEGARDTYPNTPP